MKKRICMLLEQLRQKQPLVHCITNPISINDCANALLAVGARPMMAEHPREVAGITAHAGALLLNLGNITDVRMESMQLAGQAAMQAKVPVILDLVGVACSDLRREFALHLLEQVHPAVLRGNRTEIRAMQEQIHADGVDVSREDAADTGAYLNAARQLAARYDTVVLTSGAADDVTDGQKHVRVLGGTEMLSHQNFADMRYGLDPRFRFTVSRAIYKGMLQFLCSQYNMDYVVQPLPVDHMTLRMTSENEVELTWQPVADALEPTAVAEKYIVYTRIGDGDFDNGVLVDGNSYRTTLLAGMVCSYKVTAVNKGGESFPSEILSAGRAFNSKGTVLVINGFDRISAPADFTAPAPADTLLAGFLDEQDHGVPYIHDISYIGKMKEYRRSIPWMDDDASGFGDSYGNYETQVIAGNTFDYPAIHGAAILKAGYSFVSVSNESLSPVGKGEKNIPVDMREYRYVDLILGKQCQTKMGRGGVKPLEFKTFSKPMQEAIAAYCKQGGNIFVSGAFVGTDLWDNRLATADEADKKFAMEVLKYKWRVGQAATMGKVKSVASPLDRKSVV